MLKIRKASEKDTKEILKTLKELDLFYPAQELNNFWVADKEGKIAGVVKLEEFDDFFFLGSLGIKKKYQNQGIADSLLKEILKTANKNFYLYTTIPEFFKKFGFRVISPLPTLPSRDAFECEYCSPEKCVTMVRHPNAS